MIAAIIIAYFGIGLLAVATDGMVCVIARKRFRLLPSIALCLFWPISLWLVIDGARRATKGFPSRQPEGDNE